MGLLRELAASGKVFLCVCFSIRSGSTLLTEDLSRWGIGVPGEIFQSPSYPQESDGTTARYVARLVRDSKGGAFGFKATWGQVATLLQRLRDEGVINSSQDLGAVFPGIRFVHLVRCDKVAQAVSAWRAIESGVWHWPTGSSVDAGSPPYDFLAIRALLLQILAEEWLWKSYFEQHDIRHLTVVYEDYVAHRVATLRELSHWLGTGREAGPSHDLRVMRDDWTKSVVRRVWRDLAQASDIDGPQRLETIALGSSV